MTQYIEQNIIIPPHLEGKRFDQALSWLWPHYSRTRIQQWIKQGKVTANGEKIRGKDLVQGGESIFLRAELIEEETWGPEEIPLDIIYEDEAILVINKPPNLVVHPSESTPCHTLVNGLLARYPELIQLPRAGIVHRLDKDTTGLLVVARQVEAHHSLVEQLQKRTMGRHYEALVQGILTGGGTVDAPISRDKIHRKRMAVVPHGKPATTHYRILERFIAHTRIEVTLETGRTHQIRVHMAYLHHPLVGDPVYGGRPRFPKDAPESLMEALQQFKRQALHAKELHFLHPISQQPLSFTAPIPEDMKNLIQHLRSHYDTHHHST